MQGAEPYLTRFDVELPCVVNPTETAVIDAAHKSRINYEVYFFSNEEHRKSFENNPLDYCGILTDPVTQKRFTPEPSSPALMQNGTRFIFSSDSTMNAFRNNPEFYLLPDYEMGL